MRKQDIINVAVIAHVDAGKSTLVDALLSQSGVFHENEVVVEDRTYNAYVDYTAWQSGAEGWALGEGEQDLQDVRLHTREPDPAASVGDAASQRARSSKVWSLAPVTRTVRSAVSARSTQWTLSSYSPGAGNCT